MEARMSIMIGDEVRFKNGAWKGQTGIVRDIEITPDQNVWVAVEERVTFCRQIYKIDEIEKATQ